MANITREQLWEAGSHLGHQTKRWNPKMKQYIYGVKNKNHVIDLQKTLVLLENVKKLVTNIGIKKEKILFVGTKRSAKNGVKEAALRSGNYFVNSRWLGGTLTNMKTISLRIKTLWDIENEEKTGKIKLHTKKEQIAILKEKAKLEKTLGGIKQMHKYPAALFVVDSKTDEIAIKEARKLNIPVIAICDTNADPDMVDFVIAANDDMQESVNIILNYVVDVYAEAAGIKMQPSKLRTVAPKREYNENNQNSFNNHQDRSQRNDRAPREYKPRIDAKMPIVQNQKTEEIKKETN
ncbi:30S ribosomal protein S2 [Spiroplasma endosymbiont of Labia minor]|uniref:30S ribosomal protein S2 n=1 Tax=Spiroplasma endosymbiont of Labia minor TaxID=3066305 RepID=UPI0030CF8334